MKLETQLIRGLMLIRTVLVMVCWLVTGSFISGAETNAAPDAASGGSSFVTSMELLDDKHQLGVGDRVRFRIVEDRDEPKTLTVTDSGELDIPWLGSVPAADRSCKQLAKEIKKNLEKDLYKQATVIITIESLNKSRGKVYIYGYVRVTGFQEIPTDEVFTLSKAIMRAGFTDFADKKNVKVRKNEAAGGQNLTVDVGAIIEKGKQDKDIKLEPGDMIYVPGKLLNF
jgi:protein involved in polysaccharide export with SLBB domain